jgi:RsiW-degrading membrane proteinase PrsW (M82 family)
MTAYLLIAITVISVGICYYAAKQRGLSTPFWVFLGALFGPLAVPFVFLAKSKRANSNGAH